MTHMKASAGPLRSPGFHLWHAALAWRASVQEALGDRLTATQFFVLGAIAWLGRTRGPPTQAEEAAFSATDPMTTSQVVRALEKRGLVARRDDPLDSRRWRLQATAAGREEVRETHETPSSGISRSRLRQKTSESASSTPGPWEGCVLSPISSAGSLVALASLRWPRGKKRWSRSRC